MNVLDPLTILVSHMSLHIYLIFIVVQMLSDF